MNHKNENLERMLQQFVDHIQAREMAEDIRHVDTIFDAHPAPSVSKVTTSKIKESVGYRLRHPKHTKTAWSGIAATAAVILIGLFVLHKNKEHFPSSSLSLVQSRPLGIKSFYTSDAATAELENEISHLYKDFESIDKNPYEPVNTLQLNLNQIENELTADSTEFWKG